MGSYTINLPRGLKVDIFNLPENFDEEINRVFGEYTKGTSKDYIIDRDYKWRNYPIAKQVARIGNSVVPVMAEALVKANCPYLKVGERKASPVIYLQNNGQVAFG